MTGDRVTEIESRLAAATPGPWFLDASRDGERVTYIIADILREQYGDNALSLGEDKGTADLIAAAPADLRYLLGELAKRDAALDAVQRVADAVETETGVYASLNGDNRRVARRLVADARLAITSALGEDQ